MSKEVFEALCSSCKGDSETEISEALEDKMKLYGYWSISLENIPCDTSGIFAAVIMALSGEGTGEGSLLWRMGVTREDVNLIVSIRNRIQQKIQQENQDRCNPALSDMYRVIVASSGRVPPEDEEICPA